MANPVQRGVALLQGATYSSTKLKFRGSTVRVRDETKHLEIEDQASELSTHVFNAPRFTLSATCSVIAGQTAPAKGDLMDLTITAAGGGTTTQEVVVLEAETFFEEQIQVGNFTFRWDTGKDLSPT